MNKLLVILPGYNEEENIESLIINWDVQRKILQSAGFELNIVVVDDGSTDNTAKVVEQMANRFENVTLVKHDVNKGLGEGVKTGINYALENCTDNDLICLMDADNTHLPKFIHSMTTKMNNEKVDCVIASRYQKGASIVGLAKSRQLLSDGAKIVYSATLKVPGVKDFTCGYRLYKYSILKRLKEKFNNEMITESGFTCMCELLYRLHLVGCKFAEIPFELRYDYKLGASKMRAVRNTFRSFRLIASMKRIKI